MVFLNKVSPMMERALGFPLIATHGLSVTNSKEEKIGTATVEQIWFAQLVGWRRGLINIAFAKCSFYLVRKDVLLGVLLVIKAANFEKPVGENPFRCVEIHSYEDPVVQALGSMNLVEEYIPFAPGEKMSPSIHLTVYSLQGMRQVSYTGAVMQDVSWINLRGALFATTLHLVTLYNDKQLEQYLGLDDEDTTDRT